MRLVVFGLTVSSSWGNGHATLWRGLIRALAERGVHVTFFERDQPFYAPHRDLHDLPGGELVLFTEWDAARAGRALAGADAAIVTSYCADAEAACRAVALSRVPSVFYDMDTPVTLARLAAGETVDYLPAEGLGAFDLVLSYTGGPALEALERRLGARRAAPLYGHADPTVHHRTPADARFGCDLSYIGTYASDRQAAVDALFLEPARRRPGIKAVLAGSGYPQDFPWTDNIWFVKHLPPPEHAAFYSSSALTVNTTRADMAAMGWCPSGRLFEAAACGCPVLSDRWDGLDAFFTAGEEVLLASTPEEATAALDLGPARLRQIGEAARERFMREHTSAHRADELLAHLTGLRAPEASLQRSFESQDARLQGATRMRA